MILLAAVLACVDCHRDLVERYARTPMANTSGRVRAGGESPGTVGRQFTITPGLRLLWPGGQADLTLFIGSRRMGRSFAYEYRRHLYQAPVGYYANRDSWDLAPGYERDSKPDLTRPITPDCLFCHTTRAMPRRIGRSREPCKSCEAPRSPPRFDLRTMPPLRRGAHRATG